MTHLRVSRTVHAAAADVFALLADPGRHVELDASGMVRGHVSGGADAVGDVFVMDMHNDRRGDYRTLNRVVARDPDRQFGWAPGVPGEPALGHTYTYTLLPTADGVQVVQDYDWSAMTDPDVLARMPRVSRDDLEASLGRVAALLGDDDGPRAGRYLSVARRIGAPPEDVFALLADPRRLPAIDASGSVVAARTEQSVTGVGDVFTMAMRGRDTGDYEVENHVVAYEPDRLLGWAPATTGGERGGQTWTFALTPDGDGTRVTHTYDWSEVALDRLRPYLPVVDAPGLAATLDRLADALE